MVSEPCEIALCRFFLFLLGYLIFAWLVGHVLNALLERLLEERPDSDSSTYSELRAAAAESKVVKPQVVTPFSVRRARVKLARTDSQ